MVTLADIRAAAARIAPAAVRTPLVRLDPAKLRAFGITQELPAIYLKDESAQPIRSFKLRGAYNKIAHISPDELKRGVITYSSGNHAQGVAYAARALGSASTERKQRAEALAAEHGYTIVPPYDDPAIIAGQATCGLEILQQLSDLGLTADLILSPVSGGGLLSGVATAVKLLQEAHSTEARVAHPLPSFGKGWGDTQVWGCEPEVAPDAKQSFDTRILTELPAADTTRTICDGLRTQSLGELNFEHILKYVDGIVSVSESEIRLATRLIFTCTSIVAEPSGAITLAAALFHQRELPPAQTIVAIVSGGNLDPSLRAELESETAAAPA